MAVTPPPFSTTMAVLGDTDVWMPALHSRGDEASHHVSRERQRDRETETDRDRDRETDRDRGKQREIDRGTYRETDK